MLPAATLKSSLITFGRQVFSWTKKAERNDRYLPFYFYMLPAWHRANSGHVGQRLDRTLEDASGSRVAIASFLRHTDTDKADLVSELMPLHVRCVSVI